MRFRELEKTSLQVLVPETIRKTIRRKAYREQRSLSAVTTELLCKGLDMDPGRFGLEPREKKDGARSPS